MQRCFSSLILYVQLDYQYGFFTISLGRFDMSEILKRLWSIKSELDTLIERAISSIGEVQTLDEACEAYFVLDDVFFRKKCLEIALDLCFNLEDLFSVYREVFNCDEQWMFLSIEKWQVFLLEYIKKEPNIDVACDYLLKEVPFDILKIFDQEYKAEMAEYIFKRYKGDRKADIEMHMGIC